MSSRDVRPSPIAGRWYPGSESQLVASLEAFLTPEHPLVIEGSIIGLLAPHAGHHYSGAVAGSAFALLKGMEIDVVALVGPSHYPYPSALVTSGHTAYATPLGEVPVNRELCDALSRLIPLDFVRRDQEHSLEIELPFLQYVLGSFSVIPLAMVEQSLELAQNLGHALAQVVEGQRVLLVASSDLSHFYPHTVAQRLDHVILDAVERFDPAAVIAAEENHTGFACGRGAIAAVMTAARLLGADTAQLTGYATSGDVMGDYQRVVGYGSAVFYRAS